MAMGRRPTLAREITGVIVIPLKVPLVPAKGVTEKSGENRHGPPAVETIRCLANASWL